MISRDIQAASLVCSHRYESHSALHEDHAKTCASKLGWSHLSLVQWREVREPFNQSLCLLTIYWYTLNNETSSISLHMHFHLQKQQRNKTCLCQRLALDMQSSTMVSERLDLHTLSPLLDLFDSACLTRDNWLLLDPVITLWSYCQLEVWKPMTSNSCNNVNPLLVRLGFLSARFCRMKHLSTLPFMSYLKKLA
jgi:hypothetical protein